MLNDDTLSRSSSVTEYRYVHPLSAQASQRNALCGYHWQDPKTYAFPGKVGRASWLAWESLRRNVLFQRFCEEHDPASDTSWDDSPDVSQWGLARFKHYREDICQDESTWPDWLVLRPRKVMDVIAPAITTRPKGKGSSTIQPSANSRSNVTIFKGQVAVVFDLEPIKHSKPMIDRQIEHARELLHQLANQLREEGNVDQKVETPHENSVIALLRIADAMLGDPRPTREAIAERVFPERFSKSNPDAPDPQKEMTKKVRAATNLIYRGGYLGLLSRDA